MVAVKINDDFTRRNKDTILTLLCIAIGFVVVVFTLNSFGVFDEYKGPDANIICDRISSRRPKAKFRTLKRPQARLRERSALFSFTSLKYLC